MTLNAMRLPSRVSTSANEFRRMLAALCGPPGAGHDGGTATSNVRDIATTSDNANKTTSASGTLA